jgi:flagellar motor switch protein FliG
MAKPKFMQGPGAGFQSVLEMFRVMEPAERERLLAQVRTRDPQLAQAIRQQVFQFEDILKLAAPELQRLLQRVPTGVLALALRGMSADFQAKIFASMSARVGDSLREEIAALGPKPLPDVLEARRKVVEQGRELGIEAMKV